MTNVFVPFNETQDPAGKKWGPDGYLNQSRDGERTPMQWNGETNAGFRCGGHDCPFAGNGRRIIQAVILTLMNVLYLLRFCSSSNHTWLPLSSNYSVVNVFVQSNANCSSLKVFKQLVALKQNDMTLSVRLHSLYGTSTKKSN